MIPPPAPAHPVTVTLPPPRPPRSWGALALAWGFAEATFFFIVPDVLLTWMALRDRRAAWRACLWTTAGALLGGIVMLALGRLDPVGARAFLDRVPAISPALVDRAADEMTRHGFAALFTGMITGKPFKIFAVLAGASHASVTGFLAIALAARLTRFLLLTGLAAWLSHGPLGGLAHRRKLLILAIVWAAVYTVYFSLFGF